MCNVNSWIPNVAAEPFRPEVGKVEPPAGKRYIGKIKSFNTTNGFGFIQCGETELQYGRDIFFNQAIEGGVETGAAVSFEVILNSDGRPQARHCVRRFETSYGQKKDDHVYRGKVRSFNANLGFGFIECDAAKTKFERDVFLHLQQVKDHELKVGDTIDFKIYLNMKKQPQAREIVKVQGDSAKPAPKADSSTSTIATVEEGAMMPAPPGNHKFVGRIRSYNTTQGFGFIASDQAVVMFGHQDVFIHKNHLPSKCQPGCSVEFDVQMIRNRPQARNVCLVGPEIPEVDSAKGLSFDLFTSTAPSQPTC